MARMYPGNQDFPVEKPKVLNFAIFSFKIEEAQAKAQNEEIDSEDDTDFDVEKEKSRKESSQISQKKKISMLISLYFT